jgi:L-ribulose-5-phosphate 3-epimerase
MIDRRRFARMLGGLAVAPALAACPAPSASSTPMPAAEPLYRLSLAQWSLHRRLKGRVKPDLDPMDFPREAKRLGFEAVEYVSTFYPKLAGEKLQELARRAKGEGVRSLLIMVDGQGQLGAASDRRRQRAVDAHKPWVEAIKRLGGHAIRVNAGGPGSRDELRPRVVSGLRALCEFADDLGIDVIVENHGGWSSDGAWLARVMRDVAHPRVGTLPDFGNFRIDALTSYDPYRGVRELMPFAKAVSAKSHDFDERGEEKRIDYLRMMRIVVDAGYRGYVGVEYEGSRLSEEKGILATRALLERCHKRLVAERR